MAMPDTSDAVIAAGRAGEPSALDGPVDLGAGVQLARSLAQQRHEHDRVHLLINQVAHSMQRNGWHGVRDLPDRHQALFGVEAAARWTAGSTLERPVARRDAAVSGQIINAELSMAVRVVEARLDDWQQAVGAYVWLRWLTGAEESIVYPLW